MFLKMYNGRLYAKSINHYPILNSTRLNIMLYFVQEMIDRIKESTVIVVV